MLAPRKRNRGAKRKPPVMLPVRHDMCPGSCPKLLLDDTPRCGFLCRDFGPLDTHKDGGPVKSGRCK